MLVVEFTVAVNEVGAGGEAGPGSGVGDGDGLGDGLGDGEGFGEGVVAASGTNDALLFASKLWPQFWNIPNRRARFKRISENRTCRFRKCIPIIRF